MEVRDPIHKGVSFDATEAVIADNQWVQRLRNIAQTGFAHLPFPGATHSRFSHSLGVMHLAGRAFDSAYKEWEFDQKGARERFRCAVRLAALLHDLGHAPFSHCAEFAMPPVESLGLSWLHAHNRRASHEDYTLAILEHSDLAGVIANNSSFTSRHVAALIARDVRVGDDFFRDGGFDHRRLLSQIVSSELDVDRLDYLVRDAYYTGATYGNIDVDWLITTLSAYPVDGSVSLALDSTALYAFDDFLISRHHMFLMVYFHHKAVVYEEMLRRFVVDPENAWTLPSDLEHYLHIDDIQMMTDLRNSANIWARRIVEHRPWRRIVERHGSPITADISEEARRLDEAGFNPIAVTSTGRLSRYVSIGVKRPSSPSIYVLRGGQRATKLKDATKVFERYADDRCISRVYVAPEDVARATDLLSHS